MKEVKQVENIEVDSENQVGPSHNFSLQIFQYKVIDDFIEVDHIKIIIPKYSVEPPSLGSQFLQFFAPGRS